MRIATLPPLNKGESTVQKSRLAIIVALLALATVLVAGSAKPATKTIALTGTVGPAPYSRIYSSRSSTTNPHMVHSFSPFLDKFGQKSLRVNGPVHND